MKMVKPNPTRIVNISIIACIILIILIAFSSCTTQKKATNWMLNNKGELAILCDDEFPFVPKYIEGETIIVRDTIPGVPVEIPCPEPTPENPKPSVKCPPCDQVKETHTRIDTVEVESGRKTKALETKLRKAEDGLIVTKAKLEAANKKNKNLKGSLILSGVIALILAAIIIFRR